MADLAAAAAAKKAAKADETTTKKAPAKAAAAKKVAPPAADETETEEGMFPLPAGPDLPGQAPVDYAVPEEWVHPGDSGWPAPLYRAPDLAGLQKLRVAFAPGVVEKLPKGVRDRDAHAENCSVCHGYHKPAAFHLDYVGHAVVTDRLNTVDPLWYWEPFALDPITKLPLLDYDSQNRPVGMWIKLHVAGKTMTEYGSTDPKPDGVKELIGDGIRRAAMRMGVALAMWVKGEMESVQDNPEAVGTNTGAVKQERDGAGHPVITKPQRDALIALFDPIEDEQARNALKRRFLEQFEIPKPNRLTQDRYFDAVEWTEGEVAEYLAGVGSEAPDDGSPAVDSSEPDQAGAPPDAAVSDVGDPAPSTEPPAPTEPDAAISTTDEAPEADEAPPGPSESADEGQAAVFTPSEGEQAWDGVLPAMPGSGEILYQPAEYIEGITAFEEGLPDEKSALFDEWCNDRGWLEPEWDQFPQWALHLVFTKLSAIADGSDQQGAADG